MQFQSLPGVIDYESARKLQLEMVERRADDEIEDTVLFLEHEPVITRGRGLQFTGAPRPKHMPLPAKLPDGITFAESERGGDLTYHGPGQLVIYPICKLDGRGFAPRRDIGGFLRRFERVVGDEICEMSGGRLQYAYREGATGVWVGGRKVASMGIAVKRWVTYHGLALNCVNDLGPFGLISPCGFSSEVMTRLVDLLPAVGLEDWPAARAKLEQRLAARMQELAGATSAFSVRNRFEDAFRSKSQ